MKAFRQRNTRNTGSNRRRGQEVGEERAVNLLEEVLMDGQEEKKYKHDRYGRRSGKDRRTVVTEACTPERRSGEDRRIGLERRVRFLGRV